MVYSRPPGHPREDVRRFGNCLVDVSVIVASEAWDDSDTPNYVLTLESSGGAYAKIALRGEAAREYEDWIKLAVNTAT